MKSFLIILCAGAAMPGLADAASETASTVIYNQSLQLLPSNPYAYPGLGNLTEYYSTFNGTAGIFLVQTGSSTAVSGELRPRVGSPGVFEGGYGVSNSLGIIDYGSYTVTIPTTDTTGLGVPDVLNPTKSGTFVTSGTGYDTTAGGVSGPIASLSFVRAAGSALGTYTTVSTNYLGVTSTITGTFDLLDYQGDGHLHPRSCERHSLSIVALADPSVTITGTTTYTVASNGQVNYAAFIANESTGLTFSVLAGILTRTGNTYLGPLQVVNGLPTVPWPSFVNNQFQIIDTHNTSGDGIPDFSDPLALPPNSGHSGVHAASPPRRSSSPTRRWCSPPLRPIRRPTSGNSMACRSLVPRARGSLDHETRRPPTPAPTPAPPPIPRGPPRPRLRRFRSRPPTTSAAWSISPSTPRRARARS